MGFGKLYNLAGSSCRRAVVTVCWLPSRKGPEPEPEPPKLVKSKRTNFILRASELRFMSARFDYGLNGMVLVLPLLIYMYMHIYRMAMLEYRRN